MELKIRTFQEWNDDNRQKYEEYLAEGFWSWFDKKMTTRNARIKKSYDAQLKY